MIIAVTVWGVVALVFGSVTYVMRDRPPSGLPEVNTPTSMPPCNPPRRR